MHVAIISFTKNGHETAKNIRDELELSGCSVLENVKCAGEKESYTGSLKEWTKEHWKESDALIYVGAVGIAVRAIASFVVSKKEDPAVLVVDELGTYCIPILSGHIGGANELAEMLGEKLGMQAVITTATDLNHKWAVDVFAKKNKLFISDMKLAKNVSAAILSGKMIDLEVEPEGTVKGCIPEELNMIQEKMLINDNSALEKHTDEKSVQMIHLGVRRNKKCADQALYLVPKAIILGIGCKKNAPADKIENLVAQVLQENQIATEAVKLVASIDLKKEETGLLNYCKKYEIPFQTFSKEELEQVDGTFEESAFVKQITGVDNVCERSAVCAGGEKILVHKTAKDGVTVAVAVKKWSVNFE